LLPFALVGGLTSGPVTPQALVGIALLGILGTGFAYIWNYRNMKLAGSAIASSVTYITPVVAAVLGVLFLREHVSWDQIAGGLLVLVSAALIQGRIKVLPSSRPQTQSR
jgi:drug/metabolite transporter (DMT)-like permease